MATTPPMPADPVVALLPVTQADRDLRDAIIALEWPGNHAAYEHELDQIIAAHRTPAPAGDAREDKAAFDAWVKSAPVTCSGSAYAFAAGIAHGRSPTPDSSAVSGSAEGLREALVASLAKRSVGTMDPPWTAAFNAALDMVAGDLAPFLKPGWDEDGMCNDHGRFACADCALPAVLTEGQQS